MSMERMLFNPRMLNGLQGQIVINQPETTTNWKIRRTVDQLSRVVDNALDRSLLLQVPDGNASQRAVDLETLDEDALGDELEGGDFLQDTVVGSLVEGDGVLGLILDLSLGPLLLLGGFSSRGDDGFGFGL